MPEDTLTTENKEPVVPKAVPVDPHAKCLKLSQEEKQAIIEELSKFNWMNDEMRKRVIRKLS